MHGKKIVKPYNGVLIKNFDVLEEDILDSAVLILRKRIRAIERRRLPDDLTTDALLKGECEVPQTLIEYYSKIISTKYPTKTSNNVERLAKSFSEDLIYAVTKGNIKTSKHINLGLTMKSLTNSKKVINILNKYGHCCSYIVLEELETEATFAASCRSNACPEDIILSNTLCTGVAFNNFDRFVDTTTGKDTLYDTVGIIFQNVIDCPANITRNDAPSQKVDGTEPSTSSKKDVELLMP